MKSFTCAENIQTSATEICVQIIERIKVRTINNVWAYFNYQDGMQTLKENDADI